MDIKNLIKKKLNEMDKNDLSHSDQKWIEDIIKKDKIKPQFKLVYHFQDIPLKAKTKEKAKEEAIKYASDNGFKPHHAKLIKYYLLVTGKDRATGNPNISKVEETIPLPFMP